MVAGHYGSGKTNFAVNLALHLAAGDGWAERFGLVREPLPVTLVDLDIVNPYFRAADAGELVRAAGVRLVAPRYAGSNLDIPALPPEVGQVFSADCRAVFDVGGDDAGAIALGRYAADFERAGYQFLFCVNFRRIETRTPREAYELLREIEAASRLRATAIVNNTNLGEETTAALVRESLPPMEELAALSGLPVAGVTALPGVAAELPGALPVERYIGVPF